MTNSMGNMPHQPLFYVVASLRFQPWMMLPRYIAEIQDALRDRFPLVNQIVVGTSEALGSDGEQASPVVRTSPIAWAFHTPDRTLGCQISRDQIVIHALRYSTFDDFSDTIKFILASVEKFIRQFDAGAIGIRYLDKIEPRENEKLADYIPPEYLPKKLSSSDLEPIGGLFQTMYRTDTGILQARFWTGTNYVTVPDDLIPLFLLTQDMSSNTNALNPLEPGHAILDSDSIWTSPQAERMNTEAVISKLRALHEHSNQFFRSACNEHAYKVWKGEA